MLMWSFWPLWGYGVQDAARRHASTLNEKNASRTARWQFKVLADNGCVERFGRKATVTWTPSLPCEYAVKITKMDR